MRRATIKESWNWTYQTRRAGVRHCQTEEMPAPMPAPFADTRWAEEQNTVSRCGLWDVLVAPDTILDSQFLTDYTLPQDYSKTH